MVHVSAKLVLDRVRAIALDVDGVLTDGCVWWGPAGEEWKRFSFADIMGISLALRSGIVFGLISGEDSPLVDRYAAKMQIKYVLKGCRDKAAALRTFAGSVRLDLAQICFMGDDVNDISAMEVAGFCACPCDAADEIVEYVRERGFVTKSRGGTGAVREYVDAILQSRGLSGRDIFQRS